MAQRVLVRLGEARAQGKHAVGLRPVGGERLQEPSAAAEDEACLAAVGVPASTLKVMFERADGNDEPVEFFQERRLHLSLAK